MFLHLFIIFCIFLAAFYYHDHSFRKWTEMKNREYKKYYLLFIAPFIIYILLSILNELQLFSLLGLPSDYIFIIQMTVLLLFVLSTYYFYSYYRSIQGLEVYKL